MWREGIEILQLWRSFRRGTEKHALSLAANRTILRNFGLEIVGVKQLISGISSIIHGVWFIFKRVQGVTR